MLARRPLILSLVFVWQINAVAAPLCSNAYFTEAETTAHPAAPAVAPASAAEMHAALDEMEEINRLQEALAKATDDQVGRSASEATRQRINQFKFYIENGLNDKVLKESQSSVLKIEIACARLKLDEPEVLALRAKTNLSFAEKFRLRKLERDRRRAISFIGQNFVEYRLLFKELSAYASTTPKLAAAADYVLRNLGLSKVYKNQNPAYASLPRPTMEQLQEIFSGRDPNLSPVEKNLALKSKLEKDLRVQRINNLIRRVAGLLGDKAFSDFYRAVVSKLLLTPLTLISVIEDALKPEGEAEEPDPAAEQDKILEKMAAVSFDAYAIAEHYAAAAKLSDPLMTSEQKFNLFMQLNASFGSMEGGVPTFMTTLARRPDLDPVWKELKKYVEEHHPDYVISGKLTLLGAMKQAELSRASGLLPAVFNPQKTVSFRGLKVLVIAAVTATTSYALYDKLYAEDSEPAAAATTQVGEAAPKAGEEAPKAAEAQAEKSAVDKLNGVSEEDLAILLQEVLASQKATHAHHH